MHTPWILVESPRYGEDMLFITTDWTQLRVVLRTTCVDEYEDRSVTQAELRKQLHVDLDRSFVQDASIRRPFRSCWNRILSRCCCPQRLVTACTQAGMAHALLHLGPRYQQEIIGELPHGEKQPMVVQLRCLGDKVVIQTTKTLRSFTIRANGDAVTRRRFLVVILHINGLQAKGHDHPCTCSTSLAVYEKDP